MRNDGPSPHLTWDELACADGTPYPKEWRVSRALPLGIVFEDIRALVGGPIIVNSAFRTIAYNKTLRPRSSLRSQHIQGRALDLRVPTGVDLVEFLAIAVEVARRPGSRLLGIGDYPWGLHIDIRPSKRQRLARWSGGGVSIGSVA